jgi:hypothetical protein
MCSMASRECRCRAERVGLRKSSYQPLSAGVLCFPLLQLHVFLTAGVFLVACSERNQSYVTPKLALVGSSRC